MSIKLRTERLVTKTSIFRRDGFVGEVIEAPQSKPKVTITAGQGTFKRTIISGEHLSASELEIVASILEGMHNEVAFKAEADNEARA